MKLRSVILTLAAFALLFGACNSYTVVPDNGKFFPEKVGEYKRLSPPAYSNRMSSTKYQKMPDAEIHYAFGLFQSDAEVQAEFDRKKGCDFPALPDHTGAIQPDVIKDAVLKDKSGKDIGKLRVCRVKQSQLFGTIGDYNYSVRLTNGKSVISTSTVSGNLSHLVQFIEALPLDPQIDLGSEDIKELVAANSSSPVQAADLMKKDFPVKLAGEPYIKGKYLLVKQTPAIQSAEGDNTTSTRFLTALEYRLPPEQMTDSYEEAGSVIRIDCVKGKQMADYVAKSELKQKFPAYSVNCKISVIDKTIPAIIAQKDMIGTDLLDEVSLSAKDKEVRALEPIEKIRTFIASLPRR